jgi:hypothetical protein
MTVCTKADVTWKTFAIPGTRETTADTRLSKQLCTLEISASESKFFCILAHPARRRTNIDDPEPSVEPLALASKAPTIDVTVFARLIPSPRS